MLNENTMVNDKDIMADQSNLLTTAERLKQQTSIGGWLAFFLFAIMGGGLYSAVTMIAQFNLEVVAGNWFLALADPIFGVMLFLVACYTLYSFTQRKPNAVFLAKTYIVAVFFSGLLALILNFINGEETINSRDIIRPLVWGSVWFVFLCVSKRMESVIPTAYRRTNKCDWWIPVVLMGVPILCIVIGYIQLSNDVKLYEKEQKEFLENVVLKDGEYTDGRVVFTCPSDFTCEKIEIDGEYGYSMWNDTISIAIASEFNSDVFKYTAEIYWNESTEEDLKNYNYTSLQDEEIKINGNKTFIKIGRYQSLTYAIDGSYVYRRFAVIYHKNTGKVCLVNCFDLGDDSYFQPFLNTIRFE